MVVLKPRVDIGQHDHFLIICLLLLILVTTHLLFVVIVINMDIFSRLILHLDEAVYMEILLNLYLRGFVLTNLGKAESVVGVVVAPAPNCATIIDSYGMVWTSAQITNDHVFLVSRKFEDIVTFGLRLFILLFLASVLARIIRLTLFHQVFAPLLHFSFLVDSDAIFVTARDINNLR